MILNSSLLIGLSLKSFVTHSPLFMCQPYRISSTYYFQKLNLHKFSKSAFYDLSLSKLSIYKSRFENFLERPISIQQANCIIYNGGIYGNNTNAKCLNAASCTFRNIKSNSWGGAIFASDKYTSIQISIDKCNFEYCSARISGGAIYVNGGENTNQESYLVAKSSTFSHCTIQNANDNENLCGGAIFCIAERIDVSNSMFANCGIDSENGNCFGGAIYATVNDAEKAFYFAKFIDCYASRLPISSRSPTESPTQTIPSEKFSSSEKFSYSNYFSRSNEFASTEFFSNTEIFSLSNSFTQSSDFSHSETFSESVGFSNSEFFSFSESFSNSESFTKTEDFSLSANFSYSDQFSQSSELTKSDYFTTSSQFNSSSIFSETSIFSSTEDFSISSQFSASENFTMSDTLPTKKFTLSQYFTESSKFSISDDFTKSDDFTLSNPFPSNNFTLSNQFSESSEFSLSDDFTKSSDFTISNPFPSNNFTLSDYFSTSSEFSLSEEFSKSSEFSLSEEFSKSSEFSLSEEFSKSSEFTESEPFIDSSKFTLSDEFSQSSKFTETIAFSVSSKFTMSNPFTASTQFTKSNPFSVSTQFTKSNPFSVSEEFSKSNEFTYSSSFAPSMTKINDSALILLDFYSNNMRIISSSNGGAVYLNLQERSASSKRVELYGTEFTNCMSSEGSSIYLPSTTNLVINTSRFMQNRDMSNYVPSNSAIYINSNPTDSSIFIKSCGISSLNCDHFIYAPNGRLQFLNRELNSGVLYIEGFSDVANRFSSPPYVFWGLNYDSFDSLPQPVQPQPTSSGGNPPMPLQSTSIPNGPIVPTRSPIPAKTLAPFPSSSPLIPTPSQSAAGDGSGTSDGNGTKKGLSDVAIVFIVMACLILVIGVIVTVYLLYRSGFVCFRKRSVNSNFAYKAIEYF